MQDVADRLAIMDKIYRYCHSVDRLDIAVGHSVFHEDSYADFGASYQGPGRGWIDCVCRMHRDFLHHSHQVSNVIIELDGDRAGSESYVYATLQQAQGDRIVQNQYWARYVDSWSKRDGDWAIDHRECVIDFSATGDVTTFPTNGRARRDTSDPSYAVLKG